MTDVLQPGGALSSQVKDMAHINRVEDRVREVLEGKVARGIDEAGDILLDEFFDGKPAVYRARDGKSPSLKELLKRCGSKGIFCKRTFLSNALRLAVARREIKLAAYHQLSPSHRTEMLRMDTTEGSKEIPKLEALAAIAFEDDYTVLEVRAEVKKIYGIKPAPKEITFKGAKAFFDKVYDKANNRIALNPEHLEGLTPQELEEFLLIARALRGGFTGLVETMEDMLSRPQPPAGEPKEKAGGGTKKKAAKGRRAPSRRRDAREVAAVVVEPSVEKPSVEKPSVEKLATKEPAPTVTAPPPAPPAVVATPVLALATEDQARTGYLEDLMAKQASAGVDQLVILKDGALGAAPCGPEAASPFTVFMVDLAAGDAAWAELAKAGFDAEKPAVVTAIDLLPYRAPGLCVSIYRWVHTLAAGSTLALTQMLAPDEVAPALRAPYRRLLDEQKGAGRPVLHYSDPALALELAEGFGLHAGEHVSSLELAERRGDGGKARLGEIILVSRA